MKAFLRPACVFATLLLAMLGRDASAQPGPPGLQIHCPSNFTRFICATSSSAVVNFATPGTTSPDCPGNPAVVCVPASGSTFPLGTTTVNCQATDACDQIASCSFTVTVAHDTAAPTLACTNLSVFTGNPAGRFVYFGPQTATTDGDAVISCAPPSGSWFPVGVTPVVCTARDACGNEQNCAFDVEVKLLQVHVSRGTNGPQISWDGDATLETSDSLPGNWQPIRNATSPYDANVVFVGGQRYFQLSAPPGDADCGQVVFNPSQWNINVPVARVQGRFLLNGRPFPSSFLQGANFFLRRAATGDEVYLGLSNNETFDRLVVPGIYDVIYEHKIGDAVPINSVAIVIAGLEIAGDLAFDIDVAAVGLTGAYMFNSVPAPANQVENGRVQVRDSGNGALTVLGETSDETYAAILIPGAYDLVYAGMTGANVAPANALTAFQRNVFITNNGALNIDVPVIEVTGAFTVNGAPTPESETEKGRISFLDPETQTKIQLGVTTGQQYERRVIPGTYDVHYEGLTGAHIMPANSSARFQKNVALTTNGVFNINIPVVEISGAFRVNGAPAPDSGTENALITLRQGEDLVYLGQTIGGTFQRLVIPGTYQVHYENITGGAVMPANTNAIVSTVQITNASVFNINIPVVEFDAEVTFNGGSFPGSEDGELARLYLEASGAGARIYLGTYPNPSGVSRLVVPGTYRVRYAYESGMQLPRNTYATVGSPLVVTQNLQTVINIGAAALSGSFSLNGAAFPAPSQNAAITLQSLTQGDSLYVGGTQAGTYSTVIVPGNYAAFYNWAQGDLIPRNQNARLICPR